MNCQPLLKGYAYKKLKQKQRNNIFMKCLSFFKYHGICTPWFISNMIIYMIKIPNGGMYFTAWKVFKYVVFSGPYFPLFGLNTERYGVSQIWSTQSECNKTRTRITPNKDTFDALYLWWPKSFSEQWQIYSSMNYIKVIQITMKLK